MQKDEEQNYWKSDEEGVEKTEDKPAQTQATPDEQVTSAEPEVSENEPVNEPEPFDPISWEASEYIHHERTALWALGFITITTILLALAIFIMKSYTFAALLVVMAAALAIYAKRPPHVLRYTLSSNGLDVDQKSYSFNDFRAFGILHDGALYSVLLFPTARFAPTTHVYFSEDNGEEIVDILASYLPMEDVSFDFVDNLLRRLRL